MNAFQQGRAELALRTIRTAVYPKRWEQFDKDYQLDWTSIPFHQSARKNVPDAKGIYCFFIAHGHKSVPPVGYPLYVGVVGLSANEESERSLKIRYGEYLRDVEREGARYNVRAFLEPFAGELTFMCAVVNMPPAELKKMEEDLNDALMPAYSFKDFSGTVGAQRRAWQQ